MRDERGHRANRFAGRPTWKCAGAANGPPAAPHRRAAAASPTPGGLGASEAATIAGLTGIGVSSGPAVSAVLVYRLATYWLPVLPGWYSWRLLQRMDYL